MRYLLILPLLLFSYSVSAGAKTITIGYFTVAPHLTSPEKGSTKPGGYLASFIEKNLTSKLGYKIIWKGPYSIKRTAAEAIKGSYQMAALIIKVKNNLLPSFLYSENILFDGRPSLVIKKSKNLIEIKSSKDLHNLTIGYYGNLPELAHSFLSDKKIKFNKVVGKDWFKRSFKMLEYGRHDAILMPEATPLLYMLKIKKIEKDYRIITIPGEKYTFHLGFPSINKDAKRLKKEFDKQLGKLKTSYADYLKKELNQLLH